MLLFVPKPKLDPHPTSYNQIFLLLDLFITFRDLQTTAIMSVQRVLAPLTSSTSFVFRFASSPATSSLRPCQHVLRSFSSTNSSRMSSKRKMQTSTAYQPYPLDTQPPPPRNAGVPDTSIAGGIPQVNETRPPKQTGQYEVGPERPEEQKSSISVTEQEAQVSKPAAPSAQPRAKPRPKLRARKAAMNLTPGAVNQLRAMLNQPEPKLIKVGVRNRGCSGLAYHLEYVEKPGTFDETVEQDGVKVLIDSKALFSIIGSEMDWVEDKLNQRFVFRNPNISKYFNTKFEGIF
jgi:iron-sulfur cluster assembly 1